jgi:predicted nucleotidyltransferase
MEWGFIFARFSKDRRCDNLNTMKDSIRKKVVKKMVEALKNRYHPERIILFGSEATGSPRTDSDIDLLIIKKTKKSFFQRLAEVRQVVLKQRQGYPFDPIVLTPLELQKRLEMGDQFFKSVLSEGQVLYEQ